MKIYSYCNVEGLTDVGCKRPANEDWLGTFECQNGLVAVVCDGMGGHVGGEVASHLAVETIQHFLENNYFPEAPQAIIQACDAANNAILQRTQERPELRGMGSTCVMLIVRDGKVYIGSVGDSRIYLVRNKRITQLTKDQSYVQMLVDSGAITKEEAEHHPRKNEITNALGLTNMRPATVLECPIDPQAGDCFVLCSDGLSGMVSDDEISRIVSNQEKMGQRERVETLITLAKRHGGLDNITCQIVEFALTPNDVEASNQKKKKTTLYTIIGVVGLTLIVGAFFLWGWIDKDEPYKESNEIAALRQQNNSKVINSEDTLIFKENTPILQLKENKLYGSVEVSVLKGDQIASTFVISKPLQIKDLQFIPNENLKVISEDNHTIIQFNSMPYRRNDLLMRFEYGDSVYGYKFIVVTPKSAKDNDITLEPDPMKKTSDGKLKILVDAPQEDKNDLQKPATTNEDTTKAYSENSDSSTTAASVQPKEKQNKTIGTEAPVEVTVTVSKDGNAVTVITLTSTSGTNTNEHLFTDYAIELCNINEDWYIATCKNRRDCEIRITNGKVPKNAKIEIPLLNTDIKYQIRVKKK